MSASADGYTCASHSASAGTDGDWVHVYAMDVSELIAIARKRVEAVAVLLSKFLRGIPRPMHQKSMDWIHVSDHDLERYYLGMVTTEGELAALEEHILACSPCVERAEAVQDYVDAIRAALLRISD
jgi:hypothetical protein